MPAVREAQLPYVPPPRRSGRRAGGWLLLLLALAGVGAAFFFLGRQYLADRTVFVPNVRDYTVAEATSALRQAHLRVAPDEEQRPDPTVAKGKVVGTDPTGQVRRNAQVQLVVSTGPQTVPVPALQGKKVVDAENLLTGKGLGYRVTEVNSAQDEGTVVDTDPQVGTSVRPGATVLLKVSNARVPVPNVVGQQVTDAKTLLRNSDGQFRSAARSEPTSDPTKDQVVLRVGGVDKDGTAKKGSTINLVYGVYTPPQPSGAASSGSVPGPSPS
jgi:serine/threonine-protein kinase